MGWTIVIGLIIYVGNKFQLRLEEEAKRSFELMPAVLFGLIFPVFLGLKMRLPKLLIEIKQKKVWTFDWIKFIAVALLPLYIMLMSILPFTPIGAGSMRVPEIILYGSPMIQIIAGVVFGYILLDCLKK